MAMLNAQVKLVGCDVFVSKEGLPAMPEKIAGLKLSLISNRGTKVWPGPTPKIHLTNVHCCRFVSAEKSGAEINASDVLNLLVGIESAGFEWVHVEKLLEINGKPGFAKAQGE